MNLVCPVCTEKLVAQKLGRGMAWRCQTCDGKAVNLTILKNISDAQAISDFWMAVKGGSHTDDRKCPSCRKAMRVHTAAELGGIEVDVCVICQFLWFDKSELEQVTQATKEELHKRIEDLEKLSAPLRQSERTDPALGYGFPTTRPTTLGRLFDFFFWV